MKRRCYYILADQYDKQGYIPSLVTEHEPGHAPMTGQGDGAAPWHWGKTLEEAEAVCNDVNLKQFNLTPLEAMEIVASSMRA